MKYKFISIVLGTLILAAMFSLTSCKLEEDEVNDCYLKLNFDNELVFDDKIPYGSKYDYNYFSVKDKSVDITSDIFGEWMIDIKFDEDIKVEAGKIYDNDDLRMFRVLNGGNLSLPSYGMDYSPNTKYPISLTITKTSNIDGEDFTGKFSGYVFGKYKHYISGEFLIKVEND